MKNAEGNRKQSWPLLRYYSSSAYRDWGRSQETWVRMAGHWAEIQTWDVPVYRLWV